MKSLVGGFLGGLLMVGLLAAVPAAYTFLCPDDIPAVFGSDGDFQAVYDETTDNRLELTDGTNLMAAIEDMGTTSKLTINGDIYGQDLYVNGGDIKTSSGNITIAPAGGTSFVTGILWPSSYLRATTYYGAGGSADGSLSQVAAGVTLAAGAGDPLNLDAGGEIQFRDVDAADAVRLRIDSANGNILAAADSALTLKADTDVIIELDDDTGGTESFIVKDGADAVLFEIREDGYAYWLGLPTSDPGVINQVYLEADGGGDYYLKVDGDGS